MFGRWLIRCRVYSGSMVQMSSRLSPDILNVLMTSRRKCEKKPGSGWKNGSGTNGSPESPATRQGRRVSSSFTSCDEPCIARSTGFFLTAPPLCHRIPQIKRHPLMARRNRKLSTPCWSCTGKHSLADHAGIVGIHTAADSGSVEIDFDPNQLSEQQVRALVDEHAAEMSAALKRFAFRLEGAGSEGSCSETGTASP